MPATVDNNKAEIKEAKLKRKRKKSQSKAQLRSLAFDYSFTSDDFKNMDLSTIRERIRNEKEMPQLRIPVIKKLKQEIIRFAGKEGSVLADFFSSTKLVDAIFDLMPGRQSTDDEVDIAECVHIIRKRQPISDDVANFQESLLYALESLERETQTLTRELFQKAWQIYGLDKMASAILCSSDKASPTTKTIVDFVIGLTNLKTIEVSFLERCQVVHQRLKAVENPDLGITLDMLTDVIKSKQKMFVEQIYNYLKDNYASERLCANDICFFILHFLGQEDETKVYFIFTIFDRENRGRFTFHELKDILEVCMKENGIIFDEAEIEELVKVLMEESFSEDTLKEQKDLDYKDLSSLLLKDSGKDVARALATNMDKWIVPPLDPDKKFLCSCPERLTMRYAKNNLTDVIFSMLLFFTLIMLFVTRAAQFKDVLDTDGNVCWPLMMARGSAQCINFLTGFILLMMSRPFLTLLRKHGLQVIIPIDHHVYYHKLAGVLIFAFSTAHGVAHLVNIGQNLEGHSGLKFAGLNNISAELPDDGLTYSEILFTDQLGLFGLFPGWAMPTGVLLVLVCVVMGLGSLPVIRRRGHFEVFYWSHFLYVAYMILTLLHCDHFWKWFLFPGTVFALGKLVMVYQWLTGSGKTHVVSGVLLPSKVTQLIIRRTPDFYFRPGDWIFVNLPVISRFEWHPFTISSAPEEKDVLTLHIRSVGGWTNKLNEYFVKENELILHENRDTNTILDRTSWAARMIDRVRSSIPGRSKAILKQSQIEPIHEEEEEDELPEKKEPDEITSPKNEETSITISRRGDDKDQLQDAFSAIFNNDDLDMHSVFGMYNSLQRRPSTVMYGMNNQPPQQQQLTYPDQQKRPKTSHSSMNKPLDVYLDGPHGAPASSIFEAEHAVLVATGIGVTPFASILQSIMHRYWASRSTCPRCQHQWSEGFHGDKQGTNPDPHFKLKKVDFIWINREQRAFEWFLQLLSQLEIEQAEQGMGLNQFLDVHLYITSILPATDFKAAPLHLALDLMHQKTKRDLITNLKTRTRNGRPNWDKVFKQVEEQNAGKVTVFYCGNPTLAKTLLVKSNEFGFNFKKEIF